MPAQDLLRQASSWLTALSNHARFGLNFAARLLVCGMAGFAMTSQDANSGGISPALTGVFGVESAGHGSLRTRLEYLCSHKSRHQGAHIVRPALILNLR